mgnify:FL=1
MATWINQAKDLFGSLIDGVLPSNDVLIKHTKSLARRGPGAWSANLARHGLVTNPDGVDQFDVGTVDEAGAYTATPGQLNSMLAFHVRERVRTYLGSEIKADRQATNTAVAGDAGKTPDQIKAATLVAVAAEVATELGDADSDPES